MSDFEKRRIKGSEINFPLWNTKKKIIEKNKLRNKKAVVPSLTLAPEINATFINVHIWKKKHENALVFAILQKL